MPARAPFGAWPGIVRCLSSARNFNKSLNKSADARLGTGRCPSGHRSMFYESNCHRWEETCFCRSTYCIYIDISLLKTKNIYEKTFISLEQVMIIYMKRTSAIEFFTVLSKCVFITITVRVSLDLSFFNNLFLWRNDGKFWYKCFYNCTWKFVLNRPGTVRCPADLLQRRPGARAIIEFAGDVQIAEIVGCQCYLWP